MNIKNDLLLRAARGEAIERTPVWMMRQAGRILPQYRALRKKVKNFKALIARPELACEVTLQPIKELGVDAAIIFSDILVIPEEMGLPYSMIDSIGPRFEKTVKIVKDIKSLRVCDGEELDYVYEAISLVKEDLNNKIPLIGF
ncbi:MAG: uroporphyrinogen decarboxylase, partial [Bacteroidia bacterium]|nr:uroporphyrinogen decarboxylase [Bacteroidia bacterium]